MILTAVLRNGHPLLVKHQVLALFWGSGKLLFLIFPSDPTGDIPLEVVALGGSGIHTPHTGLQNNLHKMPNMIPSMESFVTFPSETDFKFSLTHYTCHSL